MYVLEMKIEEFQWDEFFVFQFHENFCFSRNLVSSQEFDIEAGDFLTIYNACYARIWE